MVLCYNKREDFYIAKNRKRRGQKRRKRGVDKRRKMRYSEDRKPIGKETMLMAFTIGNRREVLWDGALVEESLTTALLTQGGLGDGERVFTFDMPWEETCLGYTCLCRDPKGYKLYYKSHTVKADGSWDKMYISVLESEDGFSWRRPALSLVDFPGHPVNNIVRDDIPDNFFVFYDTNPACPKEERYKAVGRAKEDGGPLRLICHVSEDGYVFRDGWELTRKGYFDTLNTVHFKDG
jgi:hypothetical protein